MTIPGPAYALMTAVSWACAVILFKKSGDDFDPVGLNTFKNVIALVLFGVTFVATGTPWGPAPAADIWALLISGAVGLGIADSLFFLSLNALGAGRQAIVDCTYSPFIVLCAFLLLGERLTILDAAGGLLVIAGMLAAVARRQEGSIEGRRLWFGLVTGVVAMMLMGIAIVAVKPILERYDVLYTTTMRMVGGVAVLVAMGGVHFPTGRRILAVFRPQPAWKFAVPGALLGTYLATLVWIAGFKYNTASVASILNQTSTIFIVLLAAVFLDEPLTRRRALAVALAFGGSVLVVV